MIRLILALVLALVAGEAWAQCANPVGGYPGFGATAGGSGQTVRTVSNLSGSGPGSLRAALEAGSGCVQFQVGGTIPLTAGLSVPSLTTIDGFTAPSPGITLDCSAAGLTVCLGVFGSSTTEKADVIIRGIRIRGGGSNQGGDSGANSADCLSIKQNVARVVLANVSTNDCGDGATDVDGDPPGLPARDITIYNSLISNNTWGLLLESAERVTIYRTLLYRGVRRNPQISTNAITSTTTDVGTDFVNNVVYGWNPTAVGNPTAAAGTILRANPSGRVLRANVRGNYYYADGGQAAHTLVLGVSGETGTVRAYITGNASGDGFNFGALTTEPAAFSTPAMTVLEACANAYLVRSTAGARNGATWGLDSLDLATIAALPTTLPGCPPPGGAGGSVIFEDTLNGAGLLTSHAPSPTGNAWVEREDTGNTQAWTITAANEVRANVAGNNQRAVYCMLPGPASAEYRVEVTLTAVPGVEGDDPLFLIARRTDGTHYLWARISQQASNSARLGIANGTTSTLATASGITWQVGDRIRFEVLSSGPTLSYTRAGTTTQIAASSNTTITAAGEACIGMGNVNFTEAAAEDITTAFGFDDAAVTLAGADAEAPTAPGTPTLTVLGADRIDAVSTPATDNVGVALYHWERATFSGSCGTYSEIGTAAEPAFSFTGLSDATTYCVRVRAEDFATPPNLSAYSAAAQATTGADGSPPTAPGSPAVVATGITSARVTYTASTDNVQVLFYAIERGLAADCSDCVQIDSASALTYTDVSLQRATQYRWRVRAWDGIQFGSYSSIVTATTPMFSGSGQAVTGGGIVSGGTVVSGGVTVP